MLTTKMIKEAPSLPLDGKQQRVEAAHSRKTG